MPLFISFEGIEGSGKSTHLRLLAEHLRASGRPVVETLEPGGTPAGIAIRGLLLARDAPLSPLAELLLYCADRAQHVSEVIRPALSQSRIVLSDRFSDSTLAYQGFGRGLDMNLVRSLDAKARDGLSPGLTLLFDCPVDEGLARTREREGHPRQDRRQLFLPRLGDRFEGEDVKFHERVRQGFLALAKKYPARFRVLDSTQPSESIHSKVVDEVQRILDAQA